MATATLRRWGRSFGVVIPSDEVARKGLRSGQRVRVEVDPLAGPDDFADLCGTQKWRKSAQEYKDEFRQLWGE